MFGLTGADQCGTGFGNDPYRRIAYLLKDLPVFLAGALVPAGGTADVETAVFIFNKMSVQIKLPQDAGGKALDIFGTLFVCQKATFEPQLPLYGVGIIAGILTDEKIMVPKPCVCGDETFAVTDGEDLGDGLSVFIQSGDGALRISQVKSKITIQDQSPPDARPFFSKLPSRTSAGRSVPSRKEGMISK